MNFPHYCTKQSTLQTTHPEIRSSKTKPEKHDLRMPLPTGDISYTAKHVPGFTKNGNRVICKKPQTSRRSSISSEKPTSRSARELSIALARFNKTKNTQNKSNSSGKNKNKKTKHERKKSQTVQFRCSEVTIRPRRAKQAKKRKRKKKRERSRNEIASRKTHFNRRRKPSTAKPDHTLAPAIAVTPPDRNDSGRPPPNRRRFLLRKTKEGKRERGEQTYARAATSELGDPGGWGGGARVNRIPERTQQRRL